MARIFLELKVAKGASQIVWTRGVANAYPLMSITDAAGTARKLGPTVDTDTQALARASEMPADPRP